MNEQEEKACNEYLNEHIEKFGEVPTMGEIWEAALKFKSDGTLYPNDSYESAEEEIEHLEDMNFELGENLKAAQDQNHYFNLMCDYRDKLCEATRVLEMVMDNTKMPHQHSDPQLRLYCLAERAKEILDAR